MQLFSEATMRIRLAKKIHKRPSRYPRGEVRKALQRLGYRLHVFKVQVPRFGPEPVSVDFGVKVEKVTAK